MKICIVTQSLGSGGAERSAAMQSIMLTELGYEVHIVLISNIISYDYKGSLFNLGELKEKGNSIFHKIKRVFLLRKHLEKNKFDFIIDNRMRTNSIFNEVGVCKYAYRKLKVLYVIHSFSYKNEIKEKSNIKKWLLKNAYKIIVVNNRLLNLISTFHHDKKMLCIENAIDFELIKSKSQEELSISYKYILFCGRLDEKSKNISLLIKAFALSEVYKKDVKLIILGEGPDKNFYEQLVSSLNIQDFIVFMPFTSNPFIYMKHALFTVLTSFYEGFPLVLVESLATGTPVVAIDCDTGPSEIIDNNVNGILLESREVKTLSYTFKNLCFNEDLLNRLGRNTIKSVQKFSKENIATKWLSAFKL